MLLECFCIFMYPIRAAEISSCCLFHCFPCLQIDATQQQTVSLFHDTRVPCLKRTNHFETKLERSDHCNASCIASLLRRSARSKDLKLGKQIHNCIVNCGFQNNTYLGNLLVHMYGKCGALQAALAVFDKLHRKNSFSWNMMIAAYSQVGQLDEAFQLFQQMPCPDIVSWNTIISACLREGQIRKALQLFGEMPARSVVSWNALITAYVQQGHVENALKLFRHMPERDVTSWNIMIGICVEKGWLTEAFHFFQEMPVKNLVSWNSIISASSQQNHFKEALQLFQQMQEDVGEADHITFVSILDGCASNSSLAVGRRVHTCIVKCEFCSDLAVWNALINMYTKCGSLEDATIVFERMPQRNVVSWSTIITAHVQHGQSTEALKLLDEMQLEGLMPNEVTIGSMLSATSYVGQLNEGCHRFVSMSKDYGIMPMSVQYCNCIIDLLSRTGHQDEAEALICNMPFLPDAIAWTAMLGCHRASAQKKLAI